MSLFGGNAEANINVEPTPVVLDAKKLIIICTKCAGSGITREYRDYYPYDHMDDGSYMAQCSFCGGTGTLQLKPPKKAKK